MDTADFILIATDGSFVDTLEFSLIIGAYDYLIWNPDPTPTPGLKMDSILSSLGFSGDYDTTLPISDVDLYRAIFVCCGMYGNKHMIGSASAEASALVSYLNNGGRMYLEGGDVWYFDPEYGGYDFGPLFGINAVSDGGDNLGPVVGESDAFTNGMNFTYGGENVWVDHINPTGTGFLIFHDGDDAYNCGVANKAGMYRTVGTSFELGLLNDGTAPSTRAVLLDSIMDFFGIGLPPDSVPPSQPYIAQAEKSGNNAELTWNIVNTDTLGNPENMNCYIVYRNTSPSFIPGPSDSVGARCHPDTTYIDSNALTAGESYYYLIKAVDETGYMSKKSNMGYVLNKFVNYNTDRSSRNWVSLPRHSEYSTVSDLVADLSPNGDPLESVTNLRDDMVEETWLYDTDFMMWFGPNNFTIDPGRGYEMVAIKDDTLVLVGSNDPDGLISLNHNTDRSSRNWVSLPYNAAYSKVSDITHEYSTAGDPLESITNLRDDMVQETWLWDTDFMMWFGPNDFAIVPGRGYELVPIKDTTWNPTEHSNVASDRMLASRGTKRSDAEIYGGQSLEPDRAPVWTVKESAKRIDYSDAKAYTLNTNRLDERADYREPGISHIVRVHLSMKESDNLAFTAYRPDQPYDVLTEKMIGSCVARRGDQAGFFFNVANFKQPWQDEEEVIIIIEATKQGRGYFTVVNVILDERVDVQDVDDITLTPIPEPVIEKGSIGWDGVDNDNVVGYSLYKDDKRLNEKVLKRTSHAAAGDVNLKPVIRGGYETIYGSDQGSQSTPDIPTPIKYAFDIFPNPFVTQARIDYAVPKQTLVEMVIYDIIGRQVKTLVSEIQKPGYYSTVWNGLDDKGRAVSSGIYFIRIEVDKFKTQDKILLLR